MPATIANPTMPESTTSTKVLTRDNVRWAQQTGQLAAESERGWLASSRAHALLAEDVNDAALIALGNAATDYKPGDGTFRDFAGPLIRAAVLDMIRGLKPLEGWKPDPAPEPRRKPGESPWRTRAKGPQTPHPEPEPERTPEQEEPPMSFASTTNGVAHAPRFATVETRPDPPPARTVTVEHGGPALTIPQLTLGDKATLRKLATARPGQHAGQIVAAFLQATGKRVDPRSVHHLGRAEGWGLVANPNRDGGKPKHTPRAEASNGRDVPKAAKGKGGRPAKVRQQTPTLAPAVTPAPPTTDARAGMRAVAAVLKALRGLPPEIAREALAVAAEAFEDAN